MTSSLRSRSTKKRSESSPRPHPPPSYPLCRQVGATTIATQMLDIYFLESSKFWSDDSDIGQVELKDQYVCRAWFAKALVCSEDVKGLTGQDLVTGVERALKCLLAGIKVALQDSRYVFLLYDAASITGTSRDHCRRVGRRHLVAITSVNDALQKVSGHEEWKAHHLRIHALCLSDAGKNADALKVLQTPSICAKRMSQSSQCWRSR